MNEAMKEDKAVAEWLASLKAEKTRKNYTERWAIWLEYCTTHGIPLSGSEQLEDMKKRRLSNDNTEKYFYDNQIPLFYQWLTTQYKGHKTHKPLSESASLSVCTAVRSFFAYHRYTLEIKKEALPSSEKVKGVVEDHAFDIYQLRSMFNMGDLKERTILACGVNLWLRAGDFVSLKRDFIELAIKREQELAENEKREPDTVEFEFTTEKEKEPCSCHLAKETTELLKDYLKAFPKTSEFLFPLNEEALSETLRRLAKRANITVSGRIRWHCLRKFGITVMHGKVTEPVMKYMVGKHIGKDLRTYIQNNRETFKAFKMLEPLISLTKQNGNGGSQQLAKQLEELKKATFKQMILLKLIEKLTPKEEMRKAIEELADELGIEKTRAISEGKAQAVDLESMINVLAEAYEKKDLERILKENGNNNH